MVNYAVFSSLIFHRKWWKPCHNSVFKIEGLFCTKMISTKIYFIKNINLVPLIPKEQELLLIILLTKNSGKQVIFNLLCSFRA